MRKITILNLIFVVVLTVLTAVAVRAQETGETPETGDQPMRPPQMLRELNLTPGQMHKLRRLMAERRQIMQQAQRSWREASRSLDLAIYADNANEEEIRTRLRAAQQAQAELLKERAMTEYLIRQVLTPEQLQKFRQLRERSMQRRDNPPLRRQSPLQRPEQHPGQSRS